MLRRKNKKTASLLVFALAYILWGIDTVYIKIVVDNMPVALFSFLRFSIAALALLPFVLKHYKKMNPRVWARLTISSLIGMSLFFLVLGEGLKRTTALNSALIFLLGPIWMYVLSIEVLKEKFNAKILLGLIVAFSGTVLVVGAPLLLGDHSLHNGSFIGNMIIFVAVFIGVLGTVMVKPVLKKAPPTQITTIRFAIVALSMLPLLFYQKPDLSTITVTPTLAFAVFYTIIIGTILAYVLYHWSLGKISGEESSTLQYLDPLLGVLASIIILGNQLTPIVLLGGALTVLGVFLSEARAKKHTFPHLRPHR